VSRSLTPLAFTLLVLKHYYPAHWADADDANEETGNSLDSRLIRARAECVEVPEALFSTLERRCFHFA
jgi:hypothetical protein